MFFTGWKTAGLAFALIILGQLQAFDWMTIIPDKETAGWVVSVIGMLVGVLRYFTNTSIFSNKPPVGNVIRGGPGSFNQ